MNRIVTALNYQQLLEIVASKFKVTPHLILSSRRDYQILIARHCFVYFMKKYSALSLNEIGRIVNRTHATVIHARNAFIAEKNVSKSIQQIAHEIEHELLTL